MFDLRPVFSPSFWFDLTPTAMSPAFDKMFFIFFAILVIAASAARMVVNNKLEDKYHKIIALRAANIAFVTGILGFVIYFFTFEEIQFFGSRFWFLALFIGVIVAVVRLLKFAKKDVPAKRKNEQSKAEVNKYLPRRN
jgi:FlaA1/EpsC-like NDP-sugar epimerase